jgi:glycerate dehydrogenase
MHKIVFLERNTFRVEFRKPGFDHEWIEYAETRADQVVERLDNATIVIANKLALRAPDLAQLPQLKMIAVAATGLDTVDLEYCRTHSIAVSNVRNYAGHSLPEHALLLMLALSRNLITYRERVRRGEWQQAQQFCLLKEPVHDVFGRTLGIVGYGFLGQAMAQLARAVGMNVLVSERKGAESIREGRVAFEEMLSRSDIVTLHCPLTEATKNLIAAPELHLMKRDALLINTARGALLNDLDLITALQEQQIAGAAVDVLREEPPRSGNLLLEADLPNLLITPHIAWASEEAMQVLADQLVDNLEAFVSGRSSNRVV